MNAWPDWPIASLYRMPKNWANNGGTETGSVALQTGLFCGPRDDAAERREVLAASSSAMIGFTQSTSHSGS
jgi:hypothetical protein